jgi:general secretion pathway protein K
MNARRERGVALIAAVLVVALAVLLVAALLDRGEAARARTRNAQRAEQGWQLMLGLEAWAGTALRQDQERDGIDSRDDVWAQDIPPIDLPQARVLGRMRELGGCFNLNSLHHDALDDTVAIERFDRLLRILKLRPGIGAQARDWIDVDQDAGTDGAEDARLMQRRPAYRAANRPFVHVSELRLLPAVDADSYATLLPHVCALPASASMNLNTISEALWMSLVENGPSAIDAARLARDGRARYPSIEAVKEEFAQLGLPPLVETGLSVKSEYFVVEAEIIADGVPFLYSSLLHRAPERIDVLARARGRY